MTKDEIKRRAEIMLAYVNEGKTIQMWSRCNSRWEDMDNPQFLEGNEYRIKPEKDVVPFKSANEFFEAYNKQKSPYLIKRSGSHYMPLVVRDYSIYTYLGQTEFKDLCNGFTFADGTPCGKEVAE